MYLLSFDDKESLFSHIKKGTYFIPLIKLLMKLNKDEPPFYHTGILLQDEEYNEYLFEVVFSKGAQIIPFKQKKETFKGDIYMQELFSSSLYIDILSILKNFHYKYSVKDAIGAYKVKISPSMSTKTRFVVRICNAILSMMGNKNDNKTYCTGALMALKDVIREYNIDIPLITTLDEMEIDFESLLPTDIYRLANNMKIKSKKISY